PELPLGVGEIVLHLLVNGETSTDLELVRSLGPGNIVANLVGIGRIVPRHPVDVVCRSGAARKLNGGNAVVNVRTAEDAIEGEVGRSLKDAGRQDVDAGAVIGKSNCVE